MSEIKNQNIKQFGRYYSPKEICDFLVKCILKKNTKNILEPSCGDGAFLESIVERQKKLGLNFDITAVEICPEEALKARKYGVDVECQDFFVYYRDKISKKISYDAILGNPPFIRPNFSCNESRNISFSCMKENGFHPTRLMSSWLPFLVLSCLALNENGRLGMVIPTELFHVNYAKKIRLFLMEYFDRLTIITFQNLVFSSIQQDVILLLGEKKSQNKGVQMITLSDLDDLKDLNIDDFHNYELKEKSYSTEKWSKYYLTNKEIKLIERLKNCSNIPFTTELFEINVGLVSGGNSFFLLDKNTVDKYQLADSTSMLVGKPRHLKGILFSELDLKKLIEANNKVYIFTPEDSPFSELNKAEQEYIKYGIKQGIDQNYKCRIRKNWYCVPKSWKPDAFIAKNIYDYPKIVLNHTNAMNTDALNKIRFFDGVDHESVAAAFLNSFTLALTQLLGNKYGGGVLTTEPGVIRQLKIPMKNAEMLDINKIDRLLRNNKIVDVLDYTDQILLIDGLGLTKSDVHTLRNIWIKLR